MTSPAPTTSVTSTSTSTAADPKIPTAAESWVIGHLCETYSRDVLVKETAYRFQLEARERLDDAVAEVRARLIQQGVRFLDRFVPNRDRRDAPGILRALTASHGETRGVFRQWVRQVVRWVFRDWVRAGRSAHLEVRVGADGASDDDASLTFERLAATVTGGRADEPQDDAEHAHAQDVVAVLLADVPADLQAMVALYLAALESPDPRAVFVAHSTSMAVVERRLATLRPQATRAMAEVGYVRARSG